MFLQIIILTLIDKIFDLQEHVNEIDFDYMEYARQRFEQYWLKKPILLGSSATVASSQDGVGFSVGK